MKKQLILLTICCLPLFAQAYELAPEYTNMAKNLNAVITADINAVYNNHQSDDKLYKKVINILDSHRATHHSYGFSDDNGTTSNFAFYLVDEIKNEIQAEGLTEQLINEPHTLNEIANHILGYGYDNKFETLLAIGIVPIEAGLRAGHAQGHNYGKYVNEALAEGKITYQHYELQNSTTAVITEQVIYVTTTEEEIQQIQEHIRQLNTIQRPQWMEEMIRDTKKGIKKTAKDFKDFLELF